LTRAPLLAALSGVLHRLQHGYRVWRADQLMPSILFDNTARADDLGLSLADIETARRRPPERDR
jgi:hypothetical protein